MRNGLFVGIDVSKERLDVAVNDGREPWQVSNDEAGHAVLDRARSRVRRPTRIANPTRHTRRTEAASLVGADER
jgi:hypothetical protein